jgi:hypothetical protein
MKRTRTSPAPSVVLAALLTCTFGCNGQAPPLDGTPTTTVAAVPLGLGLESYLFSTAPQIFHALDSRFQLTVSRQQLQQARTIHDIVPGHLKQEGVTYTVVSVRTFDGEGSTHLVAHGKGEVLDEAQRKLLGSLDYSDSFVIDARSTDNSHPSGSGNWYQHTPHVTIVPEHEAENSLGREALVAHVRSGTSAFAYRVDANTLRAGKVHFTVNKEGMLVDVRLTGSSAYPLLDKRVLELVQGFPGTWKPATNAAGEAVEQKFVFSFGIEGC